jgi:hypothetical protein
MMDNGFEIHRRYKKKKSQEIPSKNQGGIRNIQKKGEKTKLNGVLKHFYRGSSYDIALYQFQLPIESYFPNASRFEASMPIGQAKDS